MSFKEGDIVRLTTEDGSGKPMQVLEVNDSSGTTCVAVDNDDNEIHYDTMDLELYPTMDYLSKRMIKECNIIDEAVQDIRRMIKGIT